MKCITLACLTSVSVLIASPAHAFVLTFEDLQAGGGRPGYEYQETYGIVFASSFGIADHSGSAWGRPHSGTNVLVVNEFSFAAFGFKWGTYPPLYPSAASSISAYFSTEEAAVVQMLAYYGTKDDGPVASAIVGAPGESWNNVYVEMVGSPNPIGFVELLPVTTDALQHFCLDDLTIDFVPEPSSLAALGVGLMALSPVLVRRRRER